MSNHRRSYDLAKILLTLITFVYAGSAVGQDCAVTLANKVGDTISVTVVLQTDDPDENGEGEAAFFSSSGGEFAATLNAYVVPSPFSYVAVAPNETIVGTIIDGDSDETCSIVAFANQKLLLQKPPKEYFAKEGAKEAIVGAGALAFAAACEEGVITTPLCVHFAEIGADSLIAAACAVKFVLDPPDPNYMIIATPVVPPITPLSVQSGIPQNLVNATNALLLKGAEISAVSLALVTTLNRASGALVANDSIWIQRQLIAADLLKAQLAVDMAKKPDLLVAFQNALSTAGITIEITADDVETFESDVASDGLPFDQVAVLQRFGASPDIIDTATSLAFVQDASEVATFPATLTDPVLLDLLRNGSQVLLPPRRHAVNH